MPSRDAPTLATLPVDVIYFTLQHALANEPARLISGKRPRYHLLVNAALVCTTWRGPAQALLHQHIISKRAEVARWVHAPVVENGVAPRRVEIALGFDETPQEMEELVRGAMIKCSGTRELVIAGGRVDMSFLEMIQLSDLKHLSLDFNFLPTSRPSAAYMFPFALTSLALSTTGPGGHCAVLPLLTASSSTLTHLNLTSLWLTPSPTSTYSALVASFPLIAPTLTHLSIRLWRDDAEAFRPVLEQAEVLEVLTCRVHDGFHGNLPTVLGMVRAELRELRVEKWPTGEWEVLRECLNAEGMRNVCKIWLGVGEGEGVQEDEFVRECEKRGIEVVRGVAAGGFRSS